MSKDKILDKDGYVIDKKVICSENCDRCRLEICVKDDVVEIAPENKPYEPIDDDEDLEENEEREIFYGYDADELGYDE